MLGDVTRRTFVQSTAKATLLSLVPVSGCGQAGPRTSARGRERLGVFTSRLEARVPQLLHDNRVPGMSVVLIRDGGIAWRRGFGLANAGLARPVDDGTIFEAQSMSKPVFAYVVMKLSEDGVVDLDTPLTTYSRERILLNDSRLDRITARHVLSHTSGLQNWRSASEPLSIHFTPGERWLYSGEGYAYLQSIVTHLVGRTRDETCSTYEGDVKVCATDIDEFMKARLLVPFGMKSSGYVWNPAWEPHAATPHDANGQLLPKGHPTATDAARYASSGGLHATASDYAQFLIEVINPKPGDACRLSAATLKRMLTPVAAVPDDPARTSWALGWQIFPTAGGEVIAHGGNGKGFHAFAAASVGAQSGFVVMTNGDNGWRVLRELGVGGDMSQWLGFS